MFEDCLLVKMKRSRPAQVVLDSQATHAYNEENQTDVALYKNLFKNNKLVNNLNNIYQNLYQFHLKHSLPWMDEGTRIISATHYSDYMEGANDFRGHMDTTLKDMEPVYDSIIQEDIARLGGLGNPHDYPSYENYKKSWKVEIKFRPVPQSGDYRVTTPQEIKDALTKDLSDLAQSSLSLVKRNLKEAFTHAREQIEKPDGERRLFQSMLDNINDLLERVPKLNIIGDPDLNTWSEKMTTVIANYTIKDLRVYEAARKSFVTETNELMETL